MALSLERIIWYDFNGFLHVEVFVEEPFFPAKTLLDEHWEVRRSALSKGYRRRRGIRTTGA
jgi:hypothetical protein